MQIEDEKLIDLLVKETGQSKGKVKDQLDQLKNRIMRAARTGGVVEISGFGTFATKNNILDFKPSKQLKTEINQKYAGMRAIEIMEAYDAAGPEVPVDKRRYEPPVPSVSDKKVPEAGRQNSRQKPEKKVSRNAAGQSNGNNENFEQKWQEKQEKEKERANAYREQAIKESDQSGFEKEGRQGGRRPSEPHPAHREKKDSTTKLFVAAMTTAAVLLACWLLYESGTIRIPGLENSGNTSAVVDTSEQTTAQPQSPTQTQPQPEEQTQTQQIPPPEAADTAADLAGAGSADQQNATSEDAVTEDVAENQPPPAAERYGLRGTADAALSGEFTIMVHSFRLKSTVEDLSVQLNQEGYRTVLSEITGDDGSRWRLGLGQFPTEEAAENAAQQLPEPYINNYFIEQI
jgi:nucleoid DNA-binding protein